MNHPTPTFMPKPDGIDLIVHWLCIPFSKFLEFVGIGDPSLLVFEQPKAEWWNHQNIPRDYSANWSLGNLISTTLFLLLILLLSIYNLKNIILITTIFFFTNNETIKCFFFFFLYRLKEKKKLYSINWWMSNLKIFPFAIGMVPCNIRVRNIQNEMIGVKSFQLFLS